MSVKILTGDSIEQLKTLPSESVNTCVTSPPYFGLRDYGMDGQIGLEPTPDEFIARLVEVFREVRRVLRSDGTCFVNMGDSYSSTTKGSGGSNPETSPKQAWKDAENGQAFAVRRISAGETGCKPKDLIGIPWMLAFALRADGWWLRQDIIWSKPNPMPESVTDRCTKAHEYIFLLSKSAKYFCDMAAIREPVSELSQKVHGSKYAGDNETHAHSDTFQHGGSLGGNGGSRNLESGRNKRSVWTVATQPFKEAHFATFPPALIEPCILAGCPPNGTVLDPFFGAGTTGLVADRLQRNCIGIELNPKYAEIAKRRIQGDAPLFTQVCND